MKLEEVAQGVAGLALDELETQFHFRFSDDQKKAVRGRVVKRLNEVIPTQVAMWSGSGPMPEWDICSECEKPLLGGYMTVADGKGGRKHANKRQCYPG